MGLIGPRNTTIDALGNWGVTMRGITDCVTANPFHRAGACRFPYTFRATLHVEGLPYVEITGINFKRQLLTSGGIV